MLVTGTRKGLGRFLAEHYLANGYNVIGCSRSPTDLSCDNYQHYCVDVGDERGAIEMVKNIRQRYGRIDALINNAGVASMNHILLTPAPTLTRPYPPHLPLPF